MRRYARTPVKAPTKRALSVPTRRYHRDTGYILLPYVNNSLLLFTIGSE